MRFGWRLGAGLVALVLAPILKNCSTSRPTRGVLAFAPASVLHRLAADEFARLAPPTLSLVEKVLPECGFRGAKIGPTGCDSDPERGFDVEPIDIFVGHGSRDKIMTGPQGTVISRMVRLGDGAGRAGLRTGWFCSCRLAGHGEGVLTSNGTYDYPRPQGYAGPARD